jgi:hypothetical protein
MCNINNDKRLLECYKVIRTGIEFENSQIANRLNWSIASQAFLFGALAASIPITISCKKNLYFQGMFEAMGIIREWSPFYPILPFLGIVISVFVLIGTWAAILRLVSFKRKEELLRRRLDGGIYGHAVIPRNQLIHYLGLCPPIFIQVSFIIIWYLIIDPDLKFISKLLLIDLFSGNVENSLMIILLFILFISFSVILAVISIDNPCECSYLISLISIIFFLIALFILYCVPDKPLWSRLYVAFITPFYLCIATAFLSMQELRN